MSELYFKLRAKAEQERKCDAVLWHGPGHQSKAPCRLRGPHQVHEAETRGGTSTWRGKKAFTGYFDEAVECRP